MTTRRTEHLPRPVTRYRLTPSDRVQIDGIDYTPLSGDRTGYVFTQAQGDGDLALSLDHAEIEARLAAGTVVVHRNWYEPSKARQRLKNAAALLSDLPASEQRKVLWRLEHCEQFLRLEASEPAVTRSDEAMTRTIVRIQDELLRLDAARQGKPRRCGRKNEYFDPPSPRSLRRWLNAYVTSGFDPMALREGHHRSGNRTPRIDGDSREFAIKQAWNNLSLNRPKKTGVYHAYKDALVDENVEREQKGAPPLHQIGRRSFERMIGKFSPFALYAGRYGRAAALQHFALVHRGTDIIRALERVEMDEYKVSLQTILVEVGLWSRLSPKLKAAVERSRTWLTVAIDCATRCILAMRLLVASPSSESAISALEMAVFPKDGLRQAVGLEGVWEMHGVMETLATDGGAAFVAHSTQVALRDLGIAHEVPPGGMPYLRGTIERFFLTVQSQLLPLFPGQTFENAVSKGAYDAEGNACINVQELNRVLIRYAIDIYHNLPHEGLAGETPRNAWRRLNGLYGVFSPPEEPVRRHIFGITTSRDINNRGIRFLGLHYQSPQLQELRVRAGRKLIAIRVNRHDLCAISVQLDQGWISVPCVFKEIAGTSVWEWIAAAEDLKRRHADMAALSKDVVRRAMDDVRKIAAMATKRAEIGEPVLTLEDLEKAEREHFRCFEFAEGSDASDEDLLGAPDVLQPSAPPGAPDTFEEAADEFGGPADWVQE